MRPIDAEIAACVRARQHTLLRSAYLVCGDAHTAEDLVQVALEKLALRWDTTRHERPDAFVRMILYRNAAPCGARRDAATEVAQDSVLDGPMHSSLAQTAPRSNGPTAARGGGTALAWPALEPWGDTVGVPSPGPSGDYVTGWVASGGFLGEAADLGLKADGANQAVVAVRTTELPVQHAPEMRALVLGEDPPRTKGCCRVVGFYGGVGSEQVLYVSESPSGTYLLAWDIQSGSVSRVSRFPSGDAVPGLLALVAPSSPTERSGIRSSRSDGTATAMQRRRGSVVARDHGEQQRCEEGQHRHDDQEDPDDRRATGTFAL